MWRKSLVKQDKYLYFRYDFVRIYNGDETSTDLLVELTGNTSPGTLTYSSSPITINLQSDSSEPSSGFSLEYSAGMLYIELPNTDRFTLILIWLDVNENFQVNSRVSFIRLIPHGSAIAQQTTVNALPQRRNVQERQFAIQVEHAKVNIKLLLISAIC